MPNYVAYLELVKKIEAELAAVEARRTVLLHAKEVVHGYTHGPALTITDLNDRIAELAESRPAKLGPSDAIRYVFTYHATPLPRREVIDRAMERVSTPPDRARKVLDQTIRNMMKAEKIVPVENGNLALAG